MCPCTLTDTDPFRGQYSLKILTFCVKIRDLIISLLDLFTIFNLVDKKVILLSLSREKFVKLEGDFKNEIIILNSYLTQDSVDPHTHTTLSCFIKIYSKNVLCYIFAIYK